MRALVHRENQTLFAKAGTQVAGSGDRPDFFQTWLQTMLRPGVQCSPVSSPGAQDKENLIQDLSVIEVRLRLNVYLVAAVQEKSNLRSALRTYETECGLCGSCWSDFGGLRHRMVLYLVTLFVREGG